VIPRAQASFSRRRLETPSTRASGEQLVRATSERARALLEPVGEVGALAELGDAKFDRAHPWAPGSLPVAVWLVGALGAWASLPSVAERIDLGAHKGLDECGEQRAQQSGWASARCSGTRATRSVAGSGGHRGDSLLSVTAHPGSHGGRVTSGEVVY